MNTPVENFVEQAVFMAAGAKESIKALEQVINEIPH